PDAILPTMGGQTGLNCSLDLAREGVLEKYGVEMIGAKREAIDKAEDREKFKKAMAKIGLASARSALAHSLEEALQVQAMVGYPTIIRPSFTLGGTGGGIAYNREEFISIVERGLDASPTKEVLVEESVIGWKEFEMEVVRDRKDNCIIVCSIENLDPMGVHTGDSITVAPAQTLTDKEYQIMRDASIACLREIGVKTGADGVDEHNTDRDEIENELGDPGPDRIYYVADAFRVGMSIAEVHGISHIDPWFLAQIEDLVRIEREVRGSALTAFDAEA